MKPVQFNECNAIFGKDQPPYEPLPAFLIPDGRAEVITCWELSEEEKAKIQETGQIWLTLQTFGRPLQPIFLTVNKNDVIANPEGGQG